jgi:hypothetical protein
MNLPHTPTEEPVSLPNAATTTKTSACAEDMAGMISVMEGKEAPE